MYFLLFHMISSPAEIVQRAPGYATWAGCVPSRPQRRIGAAVPASRTIEHWGENGLPAFERRPWARVSARVPRRRRALGGQKKKARRHGRARGECGLGGARYAAAIMFRTDIAGYGLPLCVWLARRALP